MAAPHVHGLARISAAIVGAPVAMMLVMLAAGATLPLPADARLFAFSFLGLPAVAAAPCLALLARSGRAAWIGTAAVCIPSAAILVLV